MHIISESLAPGPGAGRAARFQGGAAGPKAAAGPEQAAELIGLSKDQVFFHIKWTEWICENLDAEIEFPIVTDHGDVANILGLVHPGAGQHRGRRQAASGGV